MSDLASAAPLLELAAAALQRVALQLLPLHRATAKLGFVATALLAGVVQEGFCTPPEIAEGVRTSYLLGFNVFKRCLAGWNAVSRCRRCKSSS